ncbi:MAG: glycine cleavage system protein H [Spirochaetales bacterium]|nr:glycine cleavage system protein H [Spirochaetales bacterium]|tara:strand:- start:369 stop:752 length:384 start_codon:yes stop_codon:yes gene_type:complete
MSEVKEELRYTEEHEWTNNQNDIVTIGITDHAQESLGEIVFIELPDVGTTLDRSSTFGVIESTKSVSDLYSPIAGEVVEVNGSVENEPDIINKNPYDEGWIIKIKAKRIEDLDSLLTAEQYKKLIDE